MSLIGWNCSQAEAQSCCLWLASSNPFGARTFKIRSAGAFFHTFENIAAETNTSIPRTANGVHLSASIASSNIKLTGILQLQSGLV